MEPSLIQEVPPTTVNLDNNSDLQLPSPSSSHEIPLSYQENLWHSMDCIVSRENSLFSFIKIIQHILTQLKDLELSYSSRFKQLLSLLSSSCSQIDNSFLSSNEPSHPFVSGIQSLLSKFYSFSDLHSNIAKTLETEYLQTISTELLSEDKKFRIIAQSIDLIHEKISYQLSEYKSKRDDYFEITKTKLQESISNNTQNEFLEKLKERLDINEKNDTLVDEYSLIYQAEKDYCNSINNTNDNFKKYEEDKRNYLSQLEEMDVNLMKKIEECIMNLYKTYSILYQDEKKVFLINDEDLNLFSIDYNKEKQLFMNRVKSDKLLPIQLEYITFPSLYQKALTFQKDSTIKPLSPEMLTQLNNVFPPKDPSLLNIKTRETIAKINALSESITKGLFPKVSSNEDINIHFGIIFESIDNQNIFLKTLNQKRSALINIKDNVYSNIKTIFKSILKNAYSEYENEKKTKKSISSEWLGIIEFVIILSQTFYNVDDNKKLLQEELAECEIWNDLIIWKKIIEHHVNVELMKQGYDEWKKKENVEMYNEKKLNLLETTLITYKYNVESFHFQESVQKKIINYILKYAKENGIDVSKFQI